LIGAQVTNFGKCQQVTARQELSPILCDIGDSAMAQDDRHRLLTSEA